MKIEEEIFKTFGEWKAAGYHVNIGEKSYMRNLNNTCVFSNKQVAKNIQPCYRYVGDIDEDDAFEYDDCGITAFDLGADF